MSPGHTEPGLQADWRLFCFSFKLGTKRTNSHITRPPSSESATMLRADKVIPAGHWSGAPADTVVLDFDGRYRRRVTMTGVGGLVFLLDLAEAAMLRGGDGLAPRGRTRGRSGRRAGTAGGTPGRRRAHADPRRLAPWQPPSADRDTAEGAAHPARSRHRGDGRGSRGAGDRARGAVQPGRRGLCARPRPARSRMATAIITITERAPSTVMAMTRPSPRRRSCASRP